MAKPESEDHKRARLAEAECERLQERLIRAQGDASRLRWRLQKSNERVRELALELSGWECDTVPGKCRGCPDCRGVIL